MTCAVESENVTQEKINKFREMMDADKGLNAWDADKSLPSWRELSGKKALEDATKERRIVEIMATVKQVNDVKEKKTWKSLIDVDGNKIKWNDIHPLFVIDDNVAIKIYSHRLRIWAVVEAEKPLLVAPYQSF